MTDTYKTVVVTGASSGIGAAIATQLCRNGSTVYAVSRTEEKLHAVRSGLPLDCRRRFMPVTCDVSDRHQVDAAFKTIARSSPIDLVVSNAGVGYGKPFSEYTHADIETVLDTNLGGTIHIIAAALRASKGAPLHIVCTSSLAGKIGFPNMSIYAASKFGIEGLVESLRNEYDPGKVSFTIFRPGITATPFFAKAGMQEYEESVRNLKSYYSSEKVADVFIKRLNPHKKTIVVGHDRYFLALLPFIPFRYRFQVLNAINKI